MSLGLSPYMSAKERSIPDGASHIPYVKSYPISRRVWLTTPAGFVKLKTFTLGFENFLISSQYSVRAGTLLIAKESPLAPVVS